MASSSCSKSERSWVSPFTWSLNWVTAVAADCNSLQRSSNLACKSSSLSARLSTSSCKWLASTPCSPASFTRSPATWRTDCSGFFSPAVSSRSAFIRSSNFGSLEAPPKASCEANLSSQRWSECWRSRKFSVKSVNLRAVSSRDCVRSNRSLFSLSQRCLTTASSLFTTSLSMSHAATNVSPSILWFSYSPERFQTSLRNVPSSFSCRSMSLRLKLAGCNVSNLFSAWVSHGKKLSWAR